MNRRRGEALVVKPSGKLPKFPDKKEEAEIIKIPAPVASRDIDYLRSLLKEKRGANACTRADYNKTRADLLTREEEFDVFRIYETIVTRAAFRFRRIEPDEQIYHDIVEGKDGKEGRKRDGGKHYREMFQRLRELVSPMDGAKPVRIEIRKEIERLDQYRRLVEELVCSTNTGLVFQIANRQGQDTSSDRGQDGLIGVCRAMETFDYRRGTKFSTYAAHQIRAHIRRARIDNGKTIRIPVHLHEDWVQVYRIQQMIYANEGQEATDEGIMEKTGLPREKLEAIRELPMALSLGNDEEGNDLLQTRFGSDAEKPDMPLIREEELRMVDEALCLLPRNHQKAMELRLGRSRYGFHTLEEAGKKLGGLTRERIRQLETESITLMQAYISLKTRTGISALKDMSEEEKLFAIVRFNLDGKGIRTRSQAKNEMKILLHPKKMGRNEFRNLEVEVLGKILRRVREGRGEIGWPEDRHWIDKIMSAGEPAPQQQREKAEKKPKKRSTESAVEGPLAILDDREREIIGLRDNLNGEGFHGVIDIEGKLGIRRSRIYKIEKRARTLMRIYTLRKSKEVQAALEKMDKDERLFATLRFDLDGEGLESRKRIGELLRMPDPDEKSTERKRTARELEDSVIRKILEELGSMDAGLAETKEGKQAAKNGPDPFVSLMQAIQEHRASSSGPTEKRI